METLNYVVWFCPAFLMTIWTMVAFIAGRFVALGTRLPTILSSHPVVFLYNRDERELASRPTLWFTVLVLFAGTLPVISLVLALSQFGCTLCSVACNYQDSRLKTRLQ